MSGHAAFADVAQALDAAGASVSAAEAHGCLCGAVCVRDDYGLADWFDEILPDAIAGSDSAFESLRSSTVAALAGDSMEFEPLLPVDDVPLPARVEALGAWCQGFLYGFGAAAPGSRHPLPEDVSEVLADLAQISNAGAVGSQSEEAEEAAYAELVEFVRATVQLVYDELAPQRASQPMSRTHQ